MARATEKQRVLSNDLLLKDGSKETGTDTYITKTTKCYKRWEVLDGYDLPNPERIWNMEHTRSNHGIKFFIILLTLLSCHPLSFMCLAVSMRCVYTQRWNMAIGKEGHKCKDYIWNTETFVFNSLLLLLNIMYLNNRHYLFADPR